MKDIILKKTTFILLLILFPFFSLNANSIFDMEIDELESYMQSNITIIDIRDDNSWKRTGIIPGSYRLNFEYSKDFNKKRWEYILIRLLKDKNIAFVLISKDGKKSKKLAKYLKDKNFNNVKYLKGGMRAWLNADRKVVNY